MREAFDHCPAGWIRQSRKCCTKIIHNQMVVDNRSMSTANFALRGFCPNVLTLKAVLMMLDLPGPQRRMANRQCAHRHRINTDMSACVCQCDYEAFSTVAHVLARCGLVFPRGCPFIAIANDKGRYRQRRGRIAISRTFPAATVSRISAIREALRERAGPARVRSPLRRGLGLLM
jgi:hypothetical protein